MRAFQRFVAFLLTLLIIGSTFVACGKEEKEIDIYLIAGQSNANGTTKITNGDEIYEDFPALQNGVPNVHYAGNARSDKGGTVVDRKFDWQPVKLGMGYQSNRMGPEAGMAKVFSTYYNEESGKECGILKMAHGGTGLCNTGGNGSNAFGDWSPPSFSKWPDENLSIKNKYVGGCYRAFISEVRQRLSELQEYGGYTKINIKGLYWMQGCNDTWRYKTDKISYPKAFSCLVSDLRRDVAEIVNELQGNDGGAANMPFFIGTISRTYRMRNDDPNGTPEATAARNLPFIEMQKKLAEDNENCYVVDNSVYDVMRWDYELNKAVVVGTDEAHWGQADCYQIGQNVGKMMLEKCIGD
jgi:hypothetical protein